MNKAQKILALICLVIALIYVITDNPSTSAYFVGLGCFNIIVAEADEIKEEINKKK